MIVELLIAITPHYQLSAKRYREQLRQRFEDWREVAGLKLGA